MDFENSREWRNRKAGNGNVCKKEGDSFVGKNIFYDHRYLANANTVMFTKNGMDTNSFRFGRVRESVDLCDMVNI